jgi:tRNA-dihydrouridine synthase B
MIDFSKTLLVLAPLAGYTDMPFRSVVKRFGADLTVSEMISSNALAYNPKKMMKFAAKSPYETPYSVQLSGYSEDVVAKAVHVLNDLKGIDCIDLNCGCPAPQVVGNNSGSALLKDLPQMGKIISCIKKESNKQYTSAKIRLGFDRKHGVEIAQACEDSGANFIAVHGRTRGQKFSGEVDFEEIARIKEAVSIPVIANGDITSYERAMEVLAITKADGLMIGRGAVGTPWIFRQIKEGKSEVTMDMKREVVLAHFEAMVDFYGERGVVMFRKHLHTYSKGIAGAAEFRVFVNANTETTALSDGIWKLFSN